MALKIDSFTCSNCQVKLKSIRMMSYCCPNCGEILLADNEQLGSSFKKQQEKATAVDVNEFLKKENKIMDLLKNKQLNEVVDQIKNMIKILNDPEVNMNAKVVVIAALAYFLLPLDVIPDIIPGFGFSDDIAVIFIALNWMNQQYNEVFKRYNLKNKVKYQLSPIIYHITRESNHSEYNYLEEKGRRIWKMSVSDLNQLGYKLIKNALVKAPESYIAHPYLSKTIIPVSTYDSVLAESVLDEQVNLARMFGAKKVEIQIFEKSSRRGAIKGNAKVKMLDMDGNLDSEKGLVFSHSYEKNFESFDDIHLEGIENIVWMFTNESSITEIVKERILHSAESMSFETNFESSNYLNSYLRASLMKKNLLDIHFKFNSEVTKKHRVKLEFHPLPNHIKENRTGMYELINTKLELRRKELMEEFNK